MNILKIKSVLFTITATIILLFQSCGNSYNGPTFTVNGKISDAEGKMLYIANMGIEKNEIVDSAELDKEGNYEFKLPAPDCFEFYLIAFEGERPIVISVDSTETITVNSSTKEFSKNYTVEGSRECLRIKELTELQTALEQQVNKMIESKLPAVIKTRNDIYALIGEFKENITREYIATAPGSASAYYALWLTLNGEPLFSPATNRADSKRFAAVATNLQNRFPEAKRAQHLAKIAKEGMEATRPKNTETVNIEESEIKTTGLFDIKLPGVNGDSISLSSFAGKVVLLDFSVYEDAKISSRNIRLREIYNKYKSKGFEIYQVSFDSREHFWQQSASNLPWTCVRDGEGAASPNVTLYNIQTVPTFYLINRENEIVLRDNQITDLEKEIEKLLK